MPEADRAIETFVMLKMIKLRYIVIYTTKDIQIKLNHVVVLFKLLENMVLKRLRFCFISY